MVLRGGYALCGISFSDPLFSFSVTQFDLMNTGKTGVVTVNELYAGMKMVKTNQTVTTKEVEEIVTRHDAKKQGGLDFEDFLRVFSRSLLFLFTSALVFESSACGTMLTEIKVLMVAIFVYLT